MKQPWRAILFLLPLAIVFGVPALVLWLGGEWTTPDTVVRRRSNDTRSFLHEPAYTDPAIYVNARVVAQRRPQVLALGNSRVLEFRREFFRPDVTFYNAGRTVSRIRHFRAFLESLPPNALPEILLIAADTAYFNIRFDLVDDDALNVAWLHNQMETYATPLQVFQTRWRDVWSDIGAGKINWSRLISLDGLSRRIGLIALSKDTGIRNDGSCRYGPNDLDIGNPRHHEEQIAHSLKDVAAGNGRFPWGDVVSEPALREMDALMDFCVARHIHLIGFMPPHAHAVWAAMQPLGEKYAYVQKLEPELRVRFAARGFEFYNFSDLAAFGSSDSEAIDGYHASERAYLRLFVSMLEQGSRLNAVADLPELRSVLAASRERPYPFPELP